MNRWFYAALVILLGLVIAQVIGTIQVYISNAELYRTLVTVRDAGYLPIPNQHIMPRLREFGPAFFGGLFFTLSIGAGLSLLSSGAAWVWDQILRRNKSFLFLCLSLWVGCLILLNYHGLRPMVTSYFLLIPPVLFVITLRWIPPQTEQRPWFYRATKMVPLLLLAITWASQLDGHLFVDLRDHLLLSNALGKKINDFYYGYTFYAAEVFKSLDQKIIKTCNLGDIKKNPVARSLQRELLNRDYLNVGGDHEVDLHVVEAGHDLVFKNRGTPVLRTTLMAFLSRPGALLKAFSLKTDGYRFFRQMTFLFLLFAFPITLYVILFCLLRLGLSPFLEFSISSAVASILCFLVGISLLIPLYLGRSSRVELIHVADALGSGKWQNRLAALKLIERKGLEIVKFPSYQDSLKSPHIPERYWLARALGVSRRPETYHDLLFLLDDPHPNVVSMAFYALGRRGDRRVVGEIVERIRQSENWYNQWYAYKALRSLGWKQSKSK